MRKRKKSACDACHSRKIKCDLAMPRCDWCFHRKIPCTFMQVVREGNESTPPIVSVPTPDEVTGHGPPAFERSQASGTGAGADASLDTHRYNKPLGRPPGGALPRGVHFGKLHFAGHDLGNICSHNGVPFFSDQGQKWIYSCTGENGLFPTLPDDSLLMAQQSLGDLLLPPMAVVEDYLWLFRSSYLKREFPVVDPVTFRDTIRVAYGPPLGASEVEYAIARASVFAFLSIMSLFVDDRSPEASHVDGEACAIKARHLLSTIPQYLGVNTLQTKLMLSLRLLFSGQIPLCALYHSLACRLVFFLGGHLVTDPWTMPDDDEVDGEVGWTAQGQRHLRKLFWLCYTLDKEISLRTGQPPAIGDDHCDLTLPGGYLDVQYLDEYLHADVAHLDESAVPLLPGDLRLTMIKSKACRLLYSAQALRKSDADLLSDIRELDKELESWRLSVPQKHRPVLSLPMQPSQWTEINRPKSSRTIVINFEYHSLMATIHQATSRCRAWTARECGEMDSVKSSLALAVEASRSTLLLLRTVVHGSLEATSWTIIFYPISAVVTIFCNILWDPLHPRAQDDLDLLSGCQELFRCKWRRCMTENEMIHLKSANDFLAELSRLAQRAISKARHEQNHSRY
ncbi:hypothetical protein HD806DRAFT_441650 [Xylariaceae sp. AK1471]|nr:hypothetical protein HD806DRAFT_441650 [Xylariaceae sp. AK1471]